MAEPAGNEVVASSPGDADQRSQPNDNMAAAAPISALSTQERTSTSFQAINVQAVAENASTAVSTAVPPPEDAAVAQDPSQTAQTAEASSAPKDASQMDEVEGIMTTDAATYGTRSRNRTGNARPNYAEDQDMDFELSTTTKKKPANDSSATTLAGQAAAEAKRAQAEFARFIAVNSGSAHANGTTTKESTPGTPGLASNVSKKRKAAGAPAGLTQTPPPSNSPVPAVTRKLAAPSATARETNVLTFTKHRSCLNKKGELVADDGTKLCINGKPGLLSAICPFSRFRPYPASSNASSLRLIFTIFRSRVSCLRASWGSILFMSNYGIFACPIR